MDELMAMVVRLVGDPTSYENMLRQAQVSTQRTATMIEGASRRIEQMGIGLRSFAGNILGALSVFGVVAGLNTLLDKFLEKEKTMRRLNVAIEANGHAVSGLLPQYKAFAESMERSTLVTKNGVFGMLKQAEVMGFTGDVAQRVVTNAIALAEGNEEQAKSFMHVASMIEHGNLQFVKRMLHLRDVKTDSELATKVQLKLAAGMKVAQSDAEGLGGQMAKLQRSLIDVTRDMGELVAKALEPVVAWLTKAVNWFKALDPELKKTAVTVLTLFAALVSLPTILGLLRPLLALFSPWMLLMTAVAAAIVIIVDQLGGWQATWEMVRDAGVSAGERILDVLNNVVKWTADLVWQNKELVLTLASIAGAVLVAVYAYRALVFVVTLLDAILTFLGIKQIIMVGLWLAWQAVVLTAAVAVGLFNIQLAFWNGLMALATFALGGFTAGTLIAKVATWLLNIALSATNVLLGASIILAAVGTVLLLAAAFATVAGLVWGVYQAGQALFSVLFTLPTASGPLATIGALFGEWYGLIKEIIAAFQKDVPLAMKMVHAAVALAVAQVKQLWTPLWTFIQTGFFAVWDLVSQRFVQSFQQAFLNVLLEMSKFGGLLGSVWTAAISGEIASLNSAIAKSQEGANRVAQAQLKLAAAQFNFGEDSDEVKNARAELEKLRAELAKVTEAKEKTGKPPTPPTLTEHFKDATKEISKFDAALFGSAEALTRIEEWKAKLADMGSKEKTTEPKRFDAASKGSAEATARKDKSEDYLKDIRDTLKEQGKKKEEDKATAVNFFPAGFLD